MTYGKAYQIGIAVTGVKVFFLLHSLFVCLDGLFIGLLWYAIVRVDWNINKWIGFVHFPVSTSEFRKFLTVLNFTVFYKSFSLVWLCSVASGVSESTQFCSSVSWIKVGFFLMDGFWILVKGFISCVDLSQWSSEKPSRA